LRPSQPPQGWWLRELLRKDYPLEQGLRLIYLAKGVASESSERIIH